MNKQQKREVDMIIDFIRKEKQKSYNEGMQKCLDSLPKEETNFKSPYQESDIDDAVESAQKEGWNDCLKVIKTNIKKLLEK